MKLLLTITVIILSLYLFNLILLVVKRARAYSMLKSLTERKNIKLKFTRSLFKGLFKISHVPDVCAEIGDKIYLLRFYNGKGRRYQVHFANEEYSVRFAVLLIRSLFAVGGRLFSGHSRQPQSTTTTSRKVKIVPKLTVPEEYESALISGKTAVPIIVFNPAPSNVSYVTDEKTSIKLAFTGDEFRGIKIFTSTSVVNFLEREAMFLEEEFKYFS